MNESTDNKAQSIKEAERLSTSIESKEKPPFPFSREVLISRGDGFVISGGTMVQEDISGNEEEISKEDKDRFYKMTFRSNSL